MKKRIREIAKTLDAWVAELHVVENGMRTDAEVKGVIRGITDGNTLPLKDVLGMPVRKVVTDVIAHAFANRLSSRLYPDGAFTVEAVSLVQARSSIRFSISLHLAYPD